MLRETFIESATMDFATINHNLTAGSIIVTGDDDNPDFEGAAIKTPSIDGGVIRGTRLEIGGGSSGYGNMSDIPGSLSDINGTEGTKLSGIETNATVGAQWPTNDGSGGNINGFPTHLIDDPTDGLNATGTAFGYYDAANTIWKTLLDNQGNAYFRGQVLVDSNPGGARVQIKETLITVFDENNVARVKIGNLA